MSPMNPTLERSSDDLSTHLHRQVIGCLGAMLPALLWMMAGRRPTAELSPWALLGSVSAYYHTSAVVAFVGVLAALGVYLLTYRGYKNGPDRLAAAVAGVAAVLVAAFPTKPPEPLADPIWWSEHTKWIHYTAAAVLFSAFAFFSLVLFRKSDQRQLAAEKKVRNAVYLLCGVGIVACMLWALIAARRKESIFWPEVLALECFALSWLVKGRAEWTAMRVVKGTIHYGRHPKQLVGDMGRSIQRLARPQEGQ